MYNSVIHTGNLQSSDQLERESSHLTLKIESSNAVNTTAITEPMLQSSSLSISDGTNNANTLAAQDSEIIPDSATSEIKVVNISEHHDLIGSTSTFSETNGQPDLNTSSFSHNNEVMSHTNPGM